MSDVVIFHNPNCSTSKYAVGVADDLGVDYSVVKYMLVAERPDRGQITELVGQLEDPPTDLVRRDANFAKLGLTDADVASFDGGFGSAYLARQVGQKFAREIFFLGREYSADDAVRMGMANAAVPHAELESTALQWAKEINAKSPTAQRMLKYAFNMIDDGLVGQQIFAGEATRLAYGTDEATEGRTSFLEKRPADWNAFPWLY